MNIDRIITESVKGVLKEIGETEKGQFLLGRLSQRQMNRGEEDTATPYAREKQNYKNAWTEKERNKANRMSSAFLKGREKEAKNMKKNTVKLNEAQLKNIIAESVKKVLNEISYDTASKAYRASCDNGDYVRNPNRAKNLYQHLIDKSSQNFDPNIDVEVVGGYGEGDYKAGELEEYFEITGYVEPSPNYIYNNSILIGAPKLKGYIGPMNDGGKLRYETQEVYDILSR